MERMDFFEKNMEILHKQDNGLYDAVQSYQTGNGLLYPEFGAAKDGTGITRITVDGRVWYLNSQYYPLREAASFVEQYSSVIDYSVMVFFGFGNGIIAGQLLQKMGEHIQFIFYEPSAEIFIHTLHNYDIADIAASDRVTIIVNGLNDSITPQVLMDYIEFDTYTIAIYDALPKYKQLFQEDYQWLENGYRQRIYDILAYINTQESFGGSMAKNNIYNLRHLLNCNYRDDFKGMFPTDMPAIVVAAGPSLEKNIHVLKQLKGRALIIAVDTALRYLAEQGLRPDLAITVDADKPIRLFEPDAVRQMQLVMDTGASRGAVDLLSGQRLIVSGGHYAYYKKVFQIANRKFAFLKNGGSVATLAFSLAWEWGFQRIVLVGQDLALAPDKVHAGSDDVDLHKLDGNKIAIEGYYGETVYTTWDYDVYRKWIEEKIQEKDCPEIINATEGGAKIAGAIQMSLQEVADTYCKKEFDFEKALQDVPPAFTEEDRPKLLALFHESEGNLKGLNRRFKEGIRLVGEELRMIRQGGYSKGKLTDIHKKVSKILAECDTFDEIQFVDAMVAKEEEHILDDIYEQAPENDEEHCRLLEKLKKYMESMLTATDETKAAFHFVIEDMELNGREPEAHS